MLLVVNAMIVAVASVCRIDVVVAMVRDSNRWQHWSWFVTCVTVTAIIILCCAALGGGRGRGGDQQAKAQQLADSQIESACNGNGDDDDDDGDNNNKNIMNNAPIPPNTIIMFFLAYSRAPRA